MKKIIVLLVIISLTGCASYQWQHPSPSRSFNSDAYDCDNYAISKMERYLEYAPPSPMTGIGMITVKKNSFYSCMEKIGWREVKVTKSEEAQQTNAERDRVEKKENEKSKKAKSLEVFNNNVKPRILRVHPDFDAIMQSKTYWEWAETQEPELKRCAMDSPDAADIIWAISEYKNAQKDDWKVVSQEPADTAAIRVDIPEYNTFVDFPTGTDPEVMEKALKENFPPRREIKKKSKINTYSRTRPNPPPPSDMLYHYDKDGVLDGVHVYDKDLGQYTLLMFSEEDAAQIRSCYKKKKAPLMAELERARTYEERMKAYNNFAESFKLEHCNNDIFVDKKINEFKRSKSIKK